jgi:hypothetical protein
MKTRSEICIFKGVLGFRNAKFVFFFSLVNDF